MKREWVQHARTYWQLYTQHKSLPASSAVCVEVVRLRYYEQATPPGWEAYINHDPESYLGHWHRLLLGCISEEEAKRIAEAEYLLTK